MHGIREDGGSGPRIELVQEQSNTLQWMNANQFKDIYVQTKNLNISEQI